MATTKKPAPAATEKEVKPVKAPVIAKPQLVAGTATEAAPAPKKAPVAKKAAAKAVPKPAATAKPAVAAAKPAVPKAKAPAKKAAKPVSTAIDPAQRANYIEVAAFYIAERRGFTPGNPEQDYLDAAAEIDRLIAAGHFAK
ncbi:MAG: DUF2934 domain-containing protein [Rhodoferax sp.]|nr:DUF2934 domain-containing protein [Rhodoferax sp.]